MTHADVIVSRKTARDGKLEIPQELAEVVSSLPWEFAIGVGERTESGTLVSMECGCRGAGERHRHYFLQADGFRTLPAESAVRVSVSDAGVTVVSVAT